MSDFNYDLNYQYKDTTGRISGGMTSQDTQENSHGLTEYRYNTLSTTVGYMYLRVPHPDQDWKKLGKFWLYGNGTAILKGSIDRYEPGKPATHRDIDIQTYRLSTKDPIGLTTNGFGAEVNGKFFPKSKVSPLAGFRFSTLGSKTYSYKIGDGDVQTQDVDSISIINTEFFVGVAFNF